MAILTEDNNHEDTQAVEVQELDDEKYNHLNSLYIAQSSAIN